MKYLTTNKLIKFVADYDYEIDKEQANQILDLLDEFIGSYNTNDIVRATDYIVEGENSRYADWF